MSRDGSTRKWDKKAAKALKKTKYILCSKRETLQKKDKVASDGKTIVHEGRFFPPQRGEGLRRHGVAAR